jgi:mannosyltransferase OCH1-like enzyme
VSDYVYVCQKKMNCASTVFVSILAILGMFVLALSSTCAWIVATKAPGFSIYESVVRSAPSPTGWYLRSSRSKQHREQRIPPRIVQSNRTVHATERMHRVSESWAKLNPTWDYEFFDDERIMQEYADTELVTYLIPRLKKQNFPGNAIADAFRAYELAERGGLWLDLDCAPHTRLNEWIFPDDDMVVYIESMGTLVHFFFAATKGHPIVRALCEEIVHAVKNEERVPAYHSGNVWGTTGPGALERAARRVTGHFGDWTEGTLQCTEGRSVRLAHAHILPGFFNNSFGLGLGIAKMPVVIKYHGYANDQAAIHN